MKRKIKFAVAFVTTVAFLSGPCVFAADAPLPPAPSVPIADSAAAGKAASGKDLVEILKEKISVDYKDTDIADILRSLSYTYSLNLVTSTEVKGKVTLSLKDVTLADTLDAVLSANGYNYAPRGNIIYVTPGGSEGVQLITEPITLQYVRAADAQNLLRKVLSPKGDMKVDELANMILVTDYEANIQKLKDLLPSVDKAPQQVLIEARIVDITSKDLRNLGVTWQMDYNPGHGIFGRKTNTSERIKGTGNFAGPSTSLSGGQFKLDTIVFKGLTASATIDALVQDHRAHLLASPSIAVLNNREARIIIGEKVPYKERTQTTTGTTETTKFIDVGTTLRVIPSINSDGYITLTIHPEVSSVKVLLDAGPQITTREADTIVRIKEGETIVIGGLIKQQDTKVKSKFPGLGDIPLLGYLFSDSARDQEQQELAVFITPKILRSREEMLKANKTHYEEEAYVNIMTVAALNAQMNLFDRAKKLQENTGLASRGKEGWRRLNEAVSLYEIIVTQFPDGPKAPEAAYQAAVIYQQMGELYQAKQACDKIISAYADSQFYQKAEQLRQQVDECIRKDARQKVQQAIEKIKAIDKEASAGLEAEILGGARTATLSARPPVEKARELEGKIKSEQAARKKAEEVAQLTEKARQLTVKEASAAKRQLSQLSAEKANLEKQVRKDAKDKIKFKDLMRQKATKEVERAREDAYKKIKEEVDLRKRLLDASRRRIEEEGERARQLTQKEYAAKMAKEQEARQQAQAEVERLRKEISQLAAAKARLQARARKEKSKEAQLLKEEARNKEQAEKKLRQNMRALEAKEAKRAKGEKAKIEREKVAQEKEVQRKQKEELASLLKEERSRKSAEEIKKKILDRQEREGQKKKAALLKEQARQQAQAEKERKAEESGQAKEKARLEKAAALKAKQEEAQAKKEALRKAKEEAAAAKDKLLSQQKDAEELEKELLKDKGRQAEAAAQEQKEKAREQAQEEALAGGGKGSSQY